MLGDFCLQLLRTWGTTVLPCFGLSLGLWIIYLDPSFIHSYKAVKNPTVSHWNWSKMACEPRTQKRKVISGGLLIYYSHFYSSFIHQYKILK
jgi:hypothetical protein